MKIVKKDDHFVACDDDGTFLSEGNIREVVLSALDADDAVEALCTFIEDEN